MYYGKSAGITLYDQSDCNSKTAWYPEDPFTLTIISGGQYASFHTIDPQTGNDVKLDSVVNATGQSILAGQFYLVADSIQPDSVAEWVVVQGESDGLTNLDSIAVFPPPVAVTFDPPEVGPGDTTTIIAKQRNADGSLADFPDDQLFEIGIWSGNKYGTILSSGDTAGYFTGTPQGFKFIAVDSIDADSVAAGIRVGVIPPAPSSIMPGNNKSSQPDSTISKSTVSVGAQPFVLKKPATDRSSAAKGHQSVSSTNNFIYDDDYGIGYVTIKREHTILLGQTKYYYAIQDPNNSNGLIIKETTTSPPVLGPEGRPDVTFDDPVAAPGSEKNPVYWEDQYPIYDSENNFEGSEKVPDGMIRVIGRYWKQDTAYKVRLHAVNLDDGSEGAIEITVKKPAVLGHPDVSVAARNSVVTDVSGVYGTPNLNLDDLIIKYAGENGIPPQLIKGQMEQECLDPETGQFEPVWRYEPFQDAQRRINDPIFQNNEFVITDNSLGGPFPSNHTNVQPMDYNRTKVRISEYLTGKNWFSVYVQRGETANDPNIILGSESWPYYLTQKWKERWDYNSAHKVEKPKDDAHNYIKALITDPSQFPGSDFDRLAQTRIWTSYGFTQMLYATAITDGKFNPETEERYAPTGTHYMDKTNVSDYPEMLNEQDTLMPRYCDLLLKNLKKLFTDKPQIPESQWKGNRGKNAYDGFEANWKASLHLYNKRANYPDEVWSKAQKYLPHE